MAKKPRIFISAVSSEFRGARQTVSQVLLRLGYDPFWQDVLSTETGDLRSMLREKIDHCDGVLQLVGHAYGFEPQVIDPEFGRISYTQFELAYARKIKKKTWVVFMGDDCTRDLPISELDLPPEEHHPDPKGYQAERRELQAAWQAKLRDNDELHHDALDDTQLELKIERLKDDLHQLLRSERVWRRVILGSVAAVVLLAAIGVGMIAAMRGDQERQQQDFQKLQELAESDIGIPFNEVTQEDLRPEFAMFSSIAIGNSPALVGSIPGSGKGLSWSVSVKVSPRATKTIGQNVKCYFSLDGKTYGEGMQASWFQVQDAAEYDHLFLKLRSFEGEEIGPFKYALDFEQYALGELRKRAENTATFAHHHGMGWRWQGNLRGMLPAIERIEYAFDPKLRSPKSISIPEGKFADRFTDEWALSLAPITSQPILPQDYTTDTLYYRFIYRDGEVGKTREAAKLSSPAVALPNRSNSPSPPLAPQKKFGDLKQDDIKVRISAFTGFSGWSLNMELPPAIYQQLSKTSPDVEVSYSLDGETYSRAFSGVLRVGRSMPIEKERIFIKLDHTKLEETKGPFEYPLNFREFTLGSMTADLKQRRLSSQRFDLFRTGQGWMTLQSYTWDQFLPAVSKIEFAFDPDLKGAEVIEIPDTELRNYWNDAWRKENQLAETYDVPENSGPLYFRLTFRSDNSQSKIRPQNIYVGQGLGSGGGGGGIGIGGL